MTRMVKDQGRLTQINNEDFHTCMIPCFLSQEEPKREEGIDYEEVFALVARIELIRLFLAYASFMGFMVYQMDVKSAFLYGTIKEEVYVCQPLGFKDSNYPDKVYKVVKALYGLHQALRAWYKTLSNYLLENDFQRGKIDQTLFIKKQKGDILLVQVYVNDIIFGSTNKDLCKAFKKLMKDKFQMSSMGELNFFLGLQVKQKPDGIFISQDKYVAEILRKFRLTDGKLASTPIDTEKPLLKDPNGEDVDVHTYRSMIGSLMYLTSSRPDIMFAVYACVDFQTVVATSSTEAEYIAAASCCAQVLWIQNQLLDYGVGTDGPGMCSVLPWLQLSSASQQLMIHAQVGDLSSHLTKYSSPALTQKVFANMRRVGKGFSGVETPLFEGMLVPQQAADDVANVAADDVDDVIAEDVVELTPPSPMPAITPPPS
nr:copia protein [Tanacetum cinerariifolium]